MIANRGKFGYFLLLAGLYVTAMVFGVSASAQSVLVQCANGKIFSSETSRGQSIEQAIAAWSTYPGVSFAEPNPVYKAAAIPTDYYISNQWYLKRIKAPQAWDIIRDAPDVTVAVIDSGVQISHPDLKDNLWVNQGEIPGNGIDDDRNGYIDDVNGYDFVNKTADPSPKFQPGFTEDGVTHGTVVAGVLGAAGNNTLGVTGVAWRVNIMALKVMDDRGETRADKVVEAINYAVRNKANIINLSFIGSGYSKALEDAIRRAYEAGIVVVAAGGNDLSAGHGQFLDNKPMYPVCMDGKPGENMVIGVAATNALDEKTSFSGYGKKCIDIAAPGMSIFSTTVYSPRHKIGENYFTKYYDGYWSGTSLAVPQVSGALALIMQANPGLRAKEAADVLLSSADNIYGVNQQYYAQLGTGRLDLLNAVVTAKARISPWKANLLVADYDVLGMVKVIRNNAIINEFQAFATGTPLSIAGGDVDGDGLPEIVAASALDNRPEIRVFSQQGKLKKSWLAFPSAFKGGINLAVADVNQDGQAEIIAAAGPGAQPEVKIYTAQGKLLKTFLAYDAKFRGGVKIAIGELYGNAGVQIITIPATNSPAQVRIFNVQGKILTQFYAYDQKIRGSFNLAIADVRGLASRESEIVVAGGKGLEPYLKFFSPSGRLVRRFAAYNTKFLGGVNVAAGDLDNDGLDEVVTGPEISGTPNVAWYKVSGRLLTTSFVAKKENKNGVNVAVFYSK
ncbi:MAG: S8 family serine peptidase [Candidatus Falkowbacteria bacterium]